jgi:hypothetical protein
MSTFLFEGQNPEHLKTLSQLFTTKQNELKTLYNTAIAEIKSLILHNLSVYRKFAYRPETPTMLLPGITEDDISDRENHSKEFADKLISSLEAPTSEKSKQKKAKQSFKTQNAQVKKDITPQKTSIMIQPQIRNPLP